MEHRAVRDSASSALPARRNVSSCMNSEPNNRPRGLAPCHFLETSPVIHGLGSEPHVHVTGPLRLVYGIGLDQSGAVLAGIGDCAVEQSMSHALPPIRGGNNEADD